MVIYSINAAGFHNTFSDVAKMQDWLDDLKVRHPWVIGGSIRIYKGERLNSVDHLTGGPVLEGTISNSNTVRN